MPPFVSFPLTVQLLCSRSGRVGWWPRRHIYNLCLGKWHVIFIADLGLPNVTNPPFQKKTVDSSNKKLAFPKHVFFGGEVRGGGYPSNNKHCWLGNLLDFSRENQPDLQIVDVPMWDYNPELKTHPMIFQIKGLQRNRRFCKENWLLLSAVAGPFTSSSQIAQQNNNLYKYTRPNGHNDIWANKNVSTNQLKKLSDIKQTLQTYKLPEWFHPRVCSPN